MGSISEYENERITVIRKLAQEGWRLKDRPKEEKTLIDKDYAIISIELLDAMMDSNIGHTILKMAIDAIKDIPEA